MVSPHSKLRSSPSSGVDAPAGAVTPRLPPGAEAGVDVGTDVLEEVFEEAVKAKFF